MQFIAEEYYRAGLERMTQARAIYQHGQSYALAIYCGGLAVECLLRAFRWQNDPSFDGRHDLSDLLTASKLMTINDAFLRRQGASDEAIRKAGLSLRAAMNEIVSLWQNNLRFASEQRLKSQLKTLGRLQGIKGDPLKKNAYDLLNAAQQVVNRGTVLWTSKID